MRKYRHCSTSLFCHSAKRVHKICSILDNFSKIIEPVKEKGHRPKAGAFNVPSPQAAWLICKSLRGFPGRESRGIPALTRPSFALSLGGSFFRRESAGMRWPFADSYHLDAINFGNFYSCRFGVCDPRMTSVPLKIWSYNHNTASNAMDIVIEILDR
jgi:hypothetical protein